MPIAHSDWPRLLTLVDQALDLPPSDRPGWLRALQLPDALKGALEGLLAQRRSIETGNFLAGLPVLPAEAPGRLAPGGRVGPWRLLHEIGEGGMSSVWLAERADDQMTRRVAIKLPHAGPRQDVLAARLMRERDILASLEHPHIARLYEVGLTDAGTPFLAMEYVEGESLLEHADSQRLTVAQRLALFLQVLQAVHFAHGKLILHRDIKPGNILVTRAGEVKLLDFGVAKLLAHEGAPHAETELTSIAGRPLTPAYASPEQLRGEPLGTASDVFSLGLVLYELLCGYRPFAVPGMSAVQVEHAVLHLEPKPLHKQTATAELGGARNTALGRLRKVLAGDLNAVVHKALAKSPGARYSSVDAMAVDVTRWLDGKPLLAQAPGYWYYFGKFVRRNKLGVGLGTAAAAALIATSALALRQGNLAAEQANRATAVRDFLVDMFGETDFDQAESKDLTAKALLESGRERASSSLAQAPELRAELLGYIGKAQMNISDRVNAEKTLAESTSAYHALGNDRQELKVLLDRADNAVSMGRHEDALTLLTQASSLLKPGETDPIVAASLFETQGMVAMFRGNEALAKSSYEQYLALAAARPETPPADLVNVLLPLAWVTSRRDDRSTALALIDKALQIVRENPDLPPTHRLDALKYRQIINYDWGLYADVVQSVPRDISDCDRELSPDSNICLRLRAQLQTALLRTGQVADAQALNDSLARMLNPSSPRDRLQATIGLARTLAWAGQIDGRPDVVQQLEHMAAPEPGQALDPHYRLLALEALAEIELLQSRPAAALERVAQADRLAESDASRPRPHATQKIRVLEGVALYLQGQPTRALSALAHFCAAASRPSGMARVQDHLYSLNCVPAMAANGQTDSAIALLKAALPVLRASMDAQSPVLAGAQSWLNELSTTGRLPPSRSPTDLLFI